MDNSKKLTMLSWFTGYGGLELGLRRAGVSTRTIAYCEREGYAAANLVAKIEAGFMDSAPIWTDAKTFPVESFCGLVDIFACGYPCQGFSAAGKRQGFSDPRFLWPWVIRAVIVIRPKRVFFENVAGHVSLGLSTVLSDLEAAGYRCSWGIFSASEVGAPHERKRVFILGELGDSKHLPGSSKRIAKQGQRPNKGPTQDAVLGGTGKHPNLRRENDGPELLAYAERAERRPQLGTRGREEHSNGSSSMADAERAGRTGRTGRTGERGDDGSEQPTAERSGCKPMADANGTKRPLHRDDLGMGWQRQWPARPGEQQHEWEPPRTTRPVERQMGRDSDGHTDWLDGRGSKARVDSLRLCGNGVVPDTAAKAWITLDAKLRKG